MAYYQLSHEVGQRRYVVASGANAGTVLQEAGDFPVGQNGMASGIPITMPLAGGEMAVSFYKEKPTEIRSDFFGTSRVEQPLSLFNYTDDYDLREDIYVTEVQGLSENGDGDTESAKWTQLEDVLVEYSPLPTGYIQHDSNRRAVRLELAKASGGFQRVRISTKKRFRYQTGRVMRSSVCLQTSLSDYPACEKLWGIGDALDGFFFQIIANGEGDNFRVVHRRSSGDGLPKETVIPRSQFNGDTLDGNGSSNASIDFTKNCMYMVEWGWYGASSARFYAFLVDDASDLPVTVSQVPRGRWVLMHELLIPDSLNAPSLGSPILPFTIEITNTGYLVEPQYLIKYGLSLQVDGGETEKADMHGLDLTNGRDIGPVLNGFEAAHYYPLFTLRAKDFAPGRLLNTLQGLPKTFSALSNYPTELVVFRDPEYGNLGEVGHVNGTLPIDYYDSYGISESVLQGVDELGNTFDIYTELPDSFALLSESIYESTDMGTLEANLTLKKTVTGKKLASFYMAADKPLQGGLTKIYDLVREAITAEYDSKFEFPAVNEVYTIDSIAVDGTILLDRKHTLEAGFRFIVGQTTYYIVSTPSVYGITIATERNGTSLSKLALQDAGIDSGVTGTGYYDLLIDQAIASRARPIDQGEVVFAARRIEDGLLVRSLDEKDAEWMRVYECTTSSTYNIVSPAPETRIFLNYGLR
ncbi:virion structural protein [Synechococcus phage S-CBS4]|uniref:virion structural protein n=1 Tax=Synechococcus phage S-CBS4 TaxID=756275 RepID=UPI000246A705|nr:virion structural protein [Synechococcus phage S-CBS4]AEX56012.1 hypothetical protein S-CBS4_gp045 [Synechococcus phage S-CBS4]AGN30509.1 hypothetical protein SXAG_00062 [Synechococcus phage S-CBS4]